MPSVRHQLMAWALPRLRKSRDLDSREAERARLERWHSTLAPRLPTRAVPGFDRRWSVEVEVEADGEGGEPTYVLTRRGRTPSATVFYVHGGGFVSPADAFHVRYATRLAEHLDAQLVLPTYPLTPEHTWRDSHERLADRLAKAATAPGRLVLAGDSAGGNIALALALTLRDRGGPQPDRIVLHAPWVDLTTSTPETEALDDVDPWLFLGKLRAYAEWWAGSADDLGRPEVSPALADLTGLPPTLMFCGTRDLLNPGCRLLVRRAREARWDLTYVEEPGLLHVYPLLPGLPEAARAWRQARDFLR